MHLFPPKTLQDIDGLVLKGGGALNIHKWLKLNYTGELKIPAFATVQRYLRKRKVDLFEHADERIRIEKLIADTDVDLSSSDQGDYPRFLKKCVALLAFRVEHIKNLNKAMGDPRYERIITDNLNSIRDMVESLHKMENQEVMGTSTIQAVSDIIASEIMGAVLESYKDLHGQKKAHEFGVKLREHISGLNMDDIQKSVEGIIKSIRKSEAKKNV